MSRNGSGTYTLPAGNPVVTGTTIESNWANTTLSDIATTLTDSLSRSGQGGMTAALRLADGTQGSPGLGFANETGSGIYRAGTGEVWAVVQGAQTLNLDANGVYVPADKTTTVDGAFVFNEAGADKDARFEGDTDANLLFVDASTDRVGVGTSTPDAKLTVNGVAAVGDGAEAAPSLANTGDLNTGLWFPAADTLAVSVGGVESVRVSSAGNLGVGTQNPVEKVTAYAAAGASYGLRSTNYTYVIDTVDASGLFRIGRNDGVVATRLAIDSSGSVGVGTTSPTFGSGTGVEIECAGVATLRLENSTASNSFELYADSAANGINLRGRDSSPMLFWTGNTERMRVFAGGGVSIGNTTDPGATNLSVTGNVTAASLNSGQLAGMRNKVINGGMDIAQRGTSFAAIASGAYSLDRWRWSNTSSAVATISQQSDSPSSNEFQNSLRIAITTADTSIAAGDTAGIQQPIEGYNVRDLIGRTFTLSFWVRSSKTGIHCVSFINSGADRSYVAEYTISAANTWEYKTVTVSGGLITAGTWDWTTGLGLRLNWALAAGSTYQTTAGSWQTGTFFATSNQVNCLDSNTNIFAITGVQLEVGSVATPFEHRLYGEELMLCQRYYEIGNYRFRGQDVASATVIWNVNYKVTKRATATLTGSVGSPGSSLNNTTAFSVQLSGAGTVDTGDISWTSAIEL